MWQSESRGAEITIRATDVLIWWIFPLPSPLCFTAFHNIVFFFYYKAPREDIYVCVHFSWNSLSAALPVATRHSRRDFSSYRQDEDMRDCFTPVESNEENRRGHGYFYTLTPTKKHQFIAGPLFAWNNHNLRQGIWISFNFFPVFIVVLAICVKAAKKKKSFKNFWGAFLQVEARLKKHPALLKHLALTQGCEDI